MADVWSTISTTYQGVNKGYIVADDYSGITFCAFSNTNTITEFKIESSYEVYDSNQADNFTYDVLEIGDGTNSVKVGTGINNTKATSLEIACSALTAINANAFSAWTSLTTLTISAPTTSVPTLGENALPSSLTKIVVPAALLSTYATADGWKDYVSILEDEDGNKYTTTALTEVGADEEITVKGNVIYLTNATKVRVVDLAGRNVYKGTTDKVVLAGKGIFIVATENCAKRVVVR